MLVYFTDDTLLFLVTELLICSVNTFLDTRLLIAYWPNCLLEVDDDKD